MEKEKLKTQTGVKPYNIAVVDIETGGFNKKKQGIVEIGIIIVNNLGEFKYSWQSLIKPYKLKDGQDTEYTDKAFDIHGITVEEMIELGHDADKVAHSIVNIMKFYNAQHVVGHNLDSFDLPWIYDFLELFGKEWKFANSIDTLKLAKKVISPKQESYSLKNLRILFGIPQVPDNEHRALSDAQVTCDLWRILEKKKK